MEGAGRLSEVNFSEKLKELYTSGHLSDVDFLVGTPPVRLKAHRSVLAMTSEVFRAMFYGALPEKMTVRIEDVDHYVFQNLLQYIYTEEVSISNFATAIDTAYACKKYMLPQTLFDLCMLHAETYFDLNDLWDAFHVAVLLEDSRLSELCKYFFILRSKTILKSEELLQCSTTYLKNLIAEISAHVDPVLLFTALVRWAENQEGLPRNTLRSLLEPFLSDIRFLAMSYEQFTRCVRQTELLKDSEYTAIAIDILRDRANRHSPRWLNPQRTITVLPLDYRVTVTTGYYKVEETARNVQLVFSFQVFNNDTFLKAVCWKVRTTGSSPPSIAAVKYVNHTKKFSAMMETAVELHKPQIQLNEFICRLTNPRLLQADDRVTVTVNLQSGVDNYLTYTKGEILEKRHNLHDGKVVIRSMPLKDSAPLSAVVLSPVL